MTDKELLNDYVASGSAEAFERLIQKHSQMVYSCCFAILRDSHGAEEATQIVFLVLVGKAKLLSSTTNLAGWLFLTARNCARRQKTREVRRAYHEREAMQMNTSQHRDLHPSDDTNVSEWKKQVTEALAELPPEQREAILLRYQYGLSEDDAAVHLGCRLRTLHTRVTRGLSNVRGHLERRKQYDAIPMLMLLLRPMEESAIPVGLAQRIVSVCSDPSTASPTMLELARSAATNSSGLTTAQMICVGLIASITIGGGALYYLQWDAQDDWTQPVNGPSAQPVQPLKETLAGEPNRRRLVILPTDDGAHLDEQKLWTVFGNATVQLSAKQLRVSLFRPSAAAEETRGGLQHQRVWDLAAGSVSIKVDAVVKDSNDFRLCAELAPNDPQQQSVTKQLYLWSRPLRVHRPDGKNYPTRASIAGVRANFDPGAVAHVDHEGQTLLGNWASLPHGKHQFELVLSKTEVCARIDGAVLYQGPYGGAATVRLSFSTSGEKSEVLIENVSLRQLSPTPNEDI